MKRIYAIITLLLFKEFASFAAMSLIKDTTSGVSFQMKTGFQRFEQENVVLYNLLENDIQTQAYIVDMGTNEPFRFPDSISSTITPTDLFIKLLIYRTQGEVEQLLDVTMKNSSINGKEIGISFLTPDSTKFLMFTQIYFYDNKLVSFSVSSSEINLDNILAEKRQYFDSIKKD